MDLEKHYFPKGSLSICGILESIEYFFEGYEGFCAFVDCLPNNPIGSLAEFLDDIVFFENMSFNFLAHLLNKAGGL